MLFVIKHASRRYNRIGIHLRVCAVVGLRIGTRIKTYINFQAAERHGEQFLLCLGRTERDTAEKNVFETFHWQVCQFYLS